MSEIMVRWKRTAKHNWYYLPTVFTSKEEAETRVPATTKDNQFYRIEIVEITPKVIVEVTPNDHSDIQGQAVESEDQKPRGRGRRNL